MLPLNQLHPNYEILHGKLQIQSSLLEPEIYRFVKEQNDWYTLYKVSPNRVEAFWSDLINSKVYESLSVKLLCFLFADPLNNIGNIWSPTSPGAGEGGGESGGKGAGGARGEIGGRSLSFDDNLIVDDDSMDSNNYLFR